MIAPAAGVHVSNKTLGRKKRSVCFVGAVVQEFQLCPLKSSEKRSSSVFRLRAERKESLGSPQTCFSCALQNIKLPHCPFSDI